MTHDTPIVTVIIDTYNYERFVGQAVDSVLAQTLPETQRELIVVDDGSTDGTASVVGRYGDRLRYIRKPNGGQASAFNAGVASARGCIICFLDADDYFYPNKLERIIGEFERLPDVGVLYNRYDLVDEEGVCRSSNLPRAMPEGDIGARILLGYTSGCPSSGISVRREVAVRVKIPEDPFRISADHFYLNILPLLTRVALIEDALHAYRTHGLNLYLGKPDPERLRIHAMQQTALWDYARLTLKKEFFRAEQELQIHGSGRMIDRLITFFRGMRYLMHSKASVALRSWTMCKLTARLLVPVTLFDRLKGLRNRCLGMGDPLLTSHKDRL